MINDTCVFLRLQSIAAPRPKVSKDFVCPRDGHFGDKNDCAKFYRCAHGDALVEYCPGGLFWNAVTDQCDWPETVDCSYNSVAMETYKVKSPVTLYMTFDDGPNEGTDAILAALRKAGVKATFFINSRNIHDPDPRVVARNVKSILTMIKDGHVLADHSYDHMYHNSKNSPKDAYVNLEEDIKYFGIMNTYPILDMLWKADLKPYIGPVNHTMTYYVRMPYTNNWRIGGQHRDCYHCTIPASSGQLGVAITNSLHNQVGAIAPWHKVEHNSLSCTFRASTSWAGTWNGRLIGTGTASSTAARRCSSRWPGTKGKWVKKLMTQKFKK